MDSISAIKQRAQALIKKGQLDKAMAEYARLAQADEVDPGLYILIGDLHLKMGDREDALERYDQAASRYDELGLVRNAIAVLKKVLRVDEKNRASHRGLAELYQRKGLIAEAVNHTLESAELAHAEGEAEEALELLQQVSEQPAPNARVTMRAASLFEALGDKQRAVAELEKQARSLEERGRAEQAKSLMEHAQTLDPNVSRAETASPADPDEGAAFATLDAEAPEAPETPETAATPLDASEIELDVPPGAADTPEPDVMPGLERSGNLFSSIKEDAGTGDEPAPEQPVAEATADPRTSNSGFYDLDAVLDDADSGQPGGAEPDVSEVFDAPAPAAPMGTPPESEGVSTWREQVRTLIGDGREQEAIDALHDWIAESAAAERHADARDQLESLWELGVRGEAVLRRLIAACDAVGDDAGFVQWEVERGEEHLRDGRWDEARACYESARERDPEHELVARRLKRLAHLSREGDEAVAADPDATPAEVSSIEDLLEAGGAPDTAEVDAPEESVSLSDAAVDASLEFLGANDSGTLPSSEPMARPGPPKRPPHELGGEIDQILDRFRADVSSQLGDEDFAGHYDLAVAYIDMGLDTEAILELEISSQGETHRQRSLDLLASCYSRLGDAQRAAEYLREALRCLEDGDGSAADLRVRLSTALSEAGERDEALAELRKVVDEHPSHQDAIQRLQAMGG